LLHQGELALAITTECERCLGDRLLLLQQQLENVDRIAQANQLPDAIITASGLRITPLANAVPDEADILMHRAYALLPHVKITEPLLEVDEWTGFTRHFTHLKSGDTAKDRILLLAVILADAISSPGHFNRQRHFLWCDRLDVPWISCLDSESCQGIGLFNLWRH
jgi:hypothetical protein